MAKEKMTGSAGAEVPEGNVKLDGDIISASKALMTSHSFEEGYPDQKGALHMRNLAGSKNGGKK